MTGCNPEYVRNVINVPMMKNKGEFQASLNAGDFMSFDPQFAYALTDNIGLMMNTSFQNTKAKMGGYHKHILGEAGIGYYNKTGKLFDFEVFAGYGYSEIETKNTIYFGGYQTFYSNAKTDRIFLQPNVGFSSNTLEGSLSSRFTYNFIHDHYHMEEKQALFIDPALSLKIGWEQLKISLQIGFSMPLYESSNVEYKPGIFSVGVHYYVNRKQK